MNARESLRRPYDIAAYTQNPGPAEYSPASLKTPRGATLSCSYRRFNYLCYSFSAGEVEQFPLIGPGRYTPQFRDHRAYSTAQISRYSNASTAWSLAVAGMTRDLQAEPSCQQYYHITNWRRPKHNPPMSDRGIAAQTLDEQITSSRRYRRNETPGPNQYSILRSKSAHTRIAVTERNMTLTLNRNPFVRTTKPEYSGCVGAYDISTKTAYGGTRRAVSCAFSRYGRNDAPVYERTFLTQGLRIAGVND